jgi:hypothetical protein
MRKPKKRKAKKASKLKESDLWGPVLDFIQQRYPGCVYHTEYEYRDIVVFHEGKVIEIELKPTFNREAIIQIASRVSIPRAHYTWSATTTDMYSVKYRPYWRGTNKLWSALGIGHLFINLTGRYKRGAGHGKCSVDMEPKINIIRPRDLLKPVTDTTMFKDLLIQTPGVKSATLYTEFKGALEKMYYEIRSMEPFTQKQFADRTSISYNKTSLQNYLKDFFLERMKVVSREKIGRSYVYTYIPHTPAQMKKKILGL